MDSFDIQEGEESFSGNELDEIEDEEGKEDRLFPEEEDESKNTEREQKSRKPILSPVVLVVLIMLTLCISAGIGFLYLKKAKPDTVSVQKEVREKELTPLVKRIAVPKDQLFSFESFIIPITEKEGFTYFFLSICFNMPNKELKEEIIENESVLRGIIFDRLREEINKTAEIPPVGTIKKFVSAELNKYLSNGVIKELYVTKFLAV